MTHDDDNFLRHREQARGTNTREASKAVRVRHVWKHLSGATGEGFLHHVAVYQMLLSVKYPVLHP